MSNLARWALEPSLPGSEDLSNILLPDVPSNVNVPDTVVVVVCGKIITLLGVISVRL